MRKSNGARVHNKKERWGERVYHEKKNDRLRVYHEKEQWGENSP